MPKNDGLEKQNLALVDFFTNVAMPKIVKEGPFGLFETPVCCKISKIERATLGGIKFSKKYHIAKKLTGTTFSHVLFWKCTNFLVEAGASRTRDRWIATKPINHSFKKWYTQNELCRLRNKQDGNV